MKNNKYLSSILRDSTPFAILPESLEKFVSMVNSKNFESFDYLNSISQSEKSDLNIIDGVAYIPIKGVIFGEENCATSLGMGVSNQQLQNLISEAIDNPDVKSILLDINTPGGEVAGTNDTANIISYANSIKPVTAYVGDLAASAGYWMASQAGKIIISETAAVGSIGVRAIIQDDSQALESKGIRQYTYLSSQSPNKDFDPQNKEHVGNLQAQLDYLAEIFINTVAKGRNVSYQTVLDQFGKGGIIYGREAVSRGMADAIGTFSDALNTLRSNDNFSKGKTMSTIKTENSENKIDTQAIQEQAIKAERERVVAIQNLFAPGEDDKKIISEAIATGASVADTAIKLLESQKSKSAKILQEREGDAKQIPVIKSEDTQEQLQSDEKVVSDLASKINHLNKVGQ